MHIFFSGIGGTGIGPLALIAKQAGFDVSGSDRQNSGYVDYLKSRGITDITIGQSGTELETLHVKNPIDWLIHSSAVTRDNPELAAATKLGIKTSKRDEFINHLLKKTGQKMIAIAGTLGKTTTTAMTIWLFKQLDIPISYSVGAKLSFGQMGEFNKEAEYFVYEADEYDRNFLSFHPEISIISGMDYDHPDTYPTKGSYDQAFSEFISQSTKVHAHSDDLQKIGLAGKPESIDSSQFNLMGEVNRSNAQLVVEAVSELLDKPVAELIAIMNRFPGVARRFEQITDNIYSDYAHTPEKIRGALQTAHEVAGDNVVVVYEGLHNTRQHFIRGELKDLFVGIKKLYVVPSYLAREDESLDLLTPEKLCEIIQKPDNREPVKLDENLKNTITEHANQGDLVLCLTAGGGGSLDEWLRAEFNTQQ